MTGMPRETSPPRMAFVKSYGKRSTRLVRTRAPGRATAAALDATCFHDTHSASCTSFATMSSRLSLWPTEGGGLATGGHDSDTPL